jgi:hypothetical protein
MKYKKKKHKHHELGQEGGVQNKTFSEWFETILSKKNLQRDIVILSLAVVGVFTFLAFKNQVSYVASNAEIPVPAFAVTKEQPVETEKDVEDPVMDTTDWQSYKNDWYGFMLKYPANWSDPHTVTGTRDTNWEGRYQFRKKEGVEQSGYAGFDVTVYDLKQLREVFYTDEFPDIKDQELTANGLCASANEHIRTNENYSVSQVHIPTTDKCYEPTLFYILTRDEYLYTISVVRQNGERFVDKFDVIKNFPEFFSVASQFNIIDIKRPKPRIIPVKINAPAPFWYAKDGAGRMVCDKKNDHPGKSKQGKKKHMDMECCLDPDEYPNPHCYYSPQKYGKYLP